MDDEVRSDEYISPDSITRNRQQIVLGLDVGTSTCQLAVSAPDGIVRRPLPIHRDGMTAYIPSLAFLTQDGKLLVAEEADDAARSARRGILLPSAKRYIRYSSSGRPLPKQLVPWPVTEPSPDDVVQALVSETLMRGMRLLQSRGVIGEEDEFRSLELRVGCMVDSDRKTREFLINCCTEVGMRKTSGDWVVEEPICAGIAHLVALGSQHGEYLVYDYGGGSFDVAFVVVADDPVRGRQFRVIGCEGDSVLGGDDIDRLLYELLLSKIAASADVSLPQLQEILSTCPEVDAQIRLTSRETKEKLSGSDSVLLTGSEMSLDLARIPRWKELMVRVEANELENLMGRDLQRSLEIVQCVVDQVAFATRRTWTEVKERISAVLLSGGMTASPLVQQGLRNLFPGADLKTPRLFSAQDCVSIGCSRSWEFDHLNQKFTTYSVHLRFDDRSERLVADSFEPVYDWWTTLFGVSSRKEFGCPSGCRSAWIVFRHATGAEHQSESVLHDPDGTVVVSYTRLGLQLRSGAKAVVVVDEPWASRNEIYRRKLELRDAEQRRERERQLETARRIQRAKELQRDRDLES